MIRRLHDYRLRLARHQQPTPEQIESTLAFDVLNKSIPRLYITQEIKNVLEVGLQRGDIVAQTILQQVHVLEKGEYLKRWARRLLENFRFSREDGVVLSYGTFGVDDSRKSVGVDVVVTTDLKLVNRYRQNYPAIQRQLRNMLQDLSSPYCDLGLPVLRSIDEITE